MAERPGIMLYFDMIEPLRGMSYDDKGKLLEAILNYGQWGEIPDFDGMLMVAWGFIRPKLDRDAEQYDKTILKRTYSSYCSKMKREGRDTEVLDYEDWLSERNRMGSNGSEWNPTTTPTPTSTPKLTSTSKSITKGEGDGEVKGEEEPSYEDLRRERMAMLRAEVSRRNQ